MLHVSAHFGKLVKICWIARFATLDFMVLHNRKTAGYEFRNLQQPKKSPPPPPKSAIEGGPFEPNQNEYFNPNCKFLAPCDEFTTPVSEFGFGTKVDDPGDDGINELACENTSI